MLKNYKMIFLSLFVVLFFIIIAAIFWANSEVKERELDEVSDTLLTIFRHELDTQKSNALFLSVSLSSEKELKDALLDEDEDKGYALLMHKLNNLRTYTFIKDVRAQMITKDLTIFARSWDNTFAGMPLDGLREDLRLLRKIRRPKVSIDPGRLLTIKATTPIKEKEKIEGYVEAVKTFTELTNILKEQGIALTVLMKDDFLRVATLMRENPTVAHFVLANQNYNAIVFRDLNTLSSKDLQREHYISSQNFLHVFDVMRDSGGEQIGVYVLSVPLDHLKRYVKMKQNISFFLNISKADLYNVVSSEFAPDESSLQEIPHSRKERIEGEIR